LRGAGGYMALVLGEVVAGSIAFLWLLPLWNEVRRGFFTLTAWIQLVLALTAWWAARAGSISGDAAGARAVHLALATVVLVLLTVIALMAKRGGHARPLGWLSVPVSISVLLALAATGRQSYGVAAFQLLAGAAYLGSITNGLLLGHWYLTDRGLGRGPINRATVAMLVSVIVQALSVIAGGFSGVASSPALNPLLTAGALAPWIALGMTGATLLIAVLTRLTLRGERASAVQSATGFYYLAVVTGFVSEVALMTRFLPR
jgi:hypothetical protein